MSQARNASARSNAGLDAPVTLKVLYDGITRRVKMPLRDMVPGSLEKHVCATPPLAPPPPFPDAGAETAVPTLLTCVMLAQVRIFLHLPVDTKIMMERFSDSAAAYVLLDTANLPVYKQLFRAAKAKSKLKIRVTLLAADERTASRPPSLADDVQSCRALASDAAAKPVVALPAAAAAAAKPELPSKLTLSSGPPLRDMVFGESMAAYPDGSLADDGGRAGDDVPAYLDSVDNGRGRILNGYLETVGNGNGGAFPDYLATVESSRAPAYLDDANVNVSAYAVHIEHSPAAMSPAACAAAAATTTGTYTFSTVSSSSCSANSGGFAVFCNRCDKTIPDVHYHCSTCDDGDFDLCQACVKRGLTCHNSGHWLNKRAIKDGHIVSSTTETLLPKRKVPSPVREEPGRVDKPAGAAAVPDMPPRCVPDLVRQQAAPTSPQSNRWACVGNMRTCNCCVQELPEREFVHCTACEDYDLCQPCFARDAHGHHPKHGFAPAVAGTKLADAIMAKLLPGRNQVHHAICDGCDKHITGVRHKCLECPDWDYCEACVGSAHFVHAKHRFAPLYEPLADVNLSAASQLVHQGICCDGPLCAMSQVYPSYIRGVRYKCAVCHDLDFCANCEANPSNTHNKTHPLIKFKTPVRHVSVTTTGEHHDGHPLPAMGDCGGDLAKAIEALRLVGVANTINTVQTVLDVEPEAGGKVAPAEAERESEPRAKSDEATKPAELESAKPVAVPVAAPVAVEPVVKMETESAKPPAAEPENKEEDAKAPTEHDLTAVFIKDTVMDGTFLPPNHEFAQSWVLRNEGSVAWPAGCSVRFVGGDYMGHVDSAHPAGISDLASAAESTVCSAALAPGREASFTARLRTPARAGKIISYWRLTTPDGYKFGHRLWCEVNVIASPAGLSRPIIEAVNLQPDDSSKSSSIMIFPKLNKELPGVDVAQGSSPDNADDPPSEAEKADAEDGLDDEEWDATDDGFLTDEEYDILDASDEEYLEDQQRKLLEK
ncbi:hypothetical protein DCS_05379 [Drechmeria coniospora]|uniref:ZZ-type domain-containing protein n=1 Tax=Drechmeria coniospora TaxID=98403 RepID=A0A151GMP2_DRECN|nr:hypothetical protein DCS_05379 [Drechmeria coniospora]KYK58366.1 hypothetical protein DCS_05379 [Drechmeria coniospora]